MKHLLSIIFIALGFVACNENNSPIAKTINAIEQNDYEKNNCFCDKIMEMQWNDFSIENKYDLAVCNYTLYNEFNSNEEHNIASFQEMLQIAMKENPKTVHNYLDAAEKIFHDTIKFIIKMDDLNKELDE